MDEEANERDSERLPPDADSDGVGGGGGGVDGDDFRVLEWVFGLPSGDDLTPLSQSLVSPELASAFSITPMDLKTLIDVHRATQHTISNLRRHNNTSSSPPVSTLKPFSTASAAADDDSILFEADDSKEPSTSRKAARSAITATATVEGDSISLRAENSADENSGRMLKRPRLVWTPQLHKRFVDVVAHLGIKNAVPKTIMQLMNVDGLTRENVASHLQKYRLYLKRMQGLSNEDPSSSDHLFASTPVPQSLQEQHLLLQPLPPPMPYTVPMMIPMSVYSMPHHHAHGVVPVNSHHGGPLYNGFDSHRPYAPNDWSGRSKFASIVSYPHVSPNDK